MKTDASSIHVDRQPRAALWAALAVAALALCCGVAYVWFAAAPVPAGGAGSGAAPPAHAPQAGPGGVGAGSTASLADLGSTRLDAARLFELGFAGGLVIDQDTRVALEILMADMADPPTAQDMQRIEDALRQGLPAREAAQAVGLLRSYRSYVGDIEQQISPRGIPANVQEMNALFDDMAAVRLKHFDPATADALFGAHEAYARYSMEASFIEQDQSLDGPARQERLDRLREQLPPQVKALVPALSPQMAQLEQDIAQARRDGATEAQVEALRQQRLAGLPAK
jgi:lipase chaperone LimK